MTLHESWKFNLISMKRKYIKTFKPSFAILCFGVRIICVSKSVSNVLKTSHTHYDEQSYAEINQVHFMTHAGYICGFGLLGNNPTFSNLFWFYNGTLIQHARVL